MVAAAATAAAAAANPKMTLSGGSSAHTMATQLTRPATQLPEGVDDGQAENAGQGELGAAGILRGNV